MQFHHHHHHHHLHRVRHRNVEARQVRVVQSRLEFANEIEEAPTTAPTMAPTTAPTQLARNQAPCLSSSSARAT